MPKSITRRSIAALSSLVVGASLVASCVPEPSPVESVVELQLLSFNDYHGHLEAPGGTDATLGAALDPSNTPVGGSEYLSTALSNLRVGKPNTLTVAAGDLIGGSPFLSGLFHDEPSVESLEAMHLDVSSVGNHEFDEGVTELKRMQYGGCHPEDGCYFPTDPYDGADFSWLAANVVGRTSRRPVLPPTSVKVVDGVKVGFIGMTLENTPELVSQSGIVGYDFLDEVTTANAAAATLQGVGVQAIVVLLHEGGLQTGTYSGCTGISGPIVEIAQNLSPAIDAVVTGHTHQPYICSIPDPAGEPRTVTSASAFGRVVTETNLQLDRTTGDVIRSSVSSTNHLVSRTVAKDPALTAIIAKWQAVSAPIANDVVGTITSDINRTVNRDAESSLANLIADAQLAATQAAGAQIAFMNPGGVRANLTYAQISGGEAAGQVTYGEAFTVQPFGNLLVTIDLSGAKVLESLEQQYIASRSRPTLIQGISSGLTFDYSLSAAQGSKISNAKLNGVAIDPAATYKVTVNLFLADGGDGFTAFTAGTNRVGGGDDLVALNDYLGANSPVAPPATDRINEVP